MVVKRFRRRRNGAHIGQVSHQCRWAVHTLRRRLSNPARRHLIPKRQLRCCVRPDHLFPAISRERLIHDSVVGPDKYGGGQSNPRSPRAGPRPLEELRDAIDLVVVPSTWKGEQFVEEGGEPRRLFRQQGRDQLRSAAFELPCASACRLPARYRSALETRVSDRSADPGPSCSPGPAFSIRTVPAWSESARLTTLRLSAGNSTRPGRGTRSGRLRCTQPRVPWQRQSQETMGIGGLCVSRAWTCAPPELAAFDDRCQRRSKIGPKGGVKLVHFSVMRYAVLRVVPLVHRRAPRCFA